MIIAITAVLVVLRERGLPARADFVDRELPERISTRRHDDLADPVPA